MSHGTSGKIHFTTLRAAAALALLCTWFSPAQGDSPPASSPETGRWFQATEQALMDSVATGDKTIWDGVMDPTCIVTSEEGRLLDKPRFLEELQPLPKGLVGSITVKDLTVHQYAGFAVVRYLADESESVFGQHLRTSYRVTDTFLRDGEAWKMVSSHFSVVTRDPPPQRVSRSGWPGFVGEYRLLPDGWSFTVQLRGDTLYGGRDPKKLKPFLPVAPNAFVLSGSLGEWIFVSEPKGRVTHILELRKFEPLVWSRVSGAAG